jgi:hypothetical protein
VTSLRKTMKFIAKNIYCALLQTTKVHELCS